MAALSNARDATSYERNVFWKCPEVTISGFTYAYNTLIIFFLREVLQDAAAD